MRGVGKKELTLRYVLESSERYQIVIWTDAKSDESMTIDFESIRRKYFKSPRNVLGTAQSNENAAATEVISWLDDAKGEWLLLIDNADDIDLRKISSWFSNSIKGHVIATTRQSNGAIMPTLESIELVGTTTSELIDIFFKNAVLANPSASQRTAAGRITQELGNSALAVELSGAYIPRKRRTYTLGCHLFLLGWKACMRSLSIDEVAKDERAVIEFGGRSLVEFLELAAVDDID
ncbi:MAG: hypothetical protein Q9191_007953 [Dirinaria sp. TL-2023a]